MSQQEKKRKIANEPEDKLKPKKKGKVAKKPESELEAFSKCPVKTARDKLELNEFKHQVLPRFEIDTIPVNAVELGKLYDNVRRAWQCRRKSNWNEAKARAFVDRVLESVVLELLTKFKTEVDDEAPVIGQENRGKVDIAIVFDDAILLVVEIKAFCIDTAIAQCLLEMEAAHEQNIEGGIDLGDTMFGIATTGHQWVLVKAIFGADKPVVTVTEIIDLSIKNKSLDKEMVSKQLERIHGQITPLLVEQAEKYKPAAKSV
jgi:hypothetical protein